MTVTAISGVVADMVLHDVIDNPHSFIPLSLTREGNEGSVDFLHHVSAGVDVVVKTFHDPFFPDAVDRHRRASDILRHVMPDTPRCLVVSDRVMVSLYAGAAQSVPSSDVYPLDAIVDRLPTPVVSVPLLVHCLAAMAVGKGDAVENALGYVVDDGFHIVPIDNSYTFFELPASTDDHVIDTFDFDDDLHYHLSLATPASESLVRNILSALQAANESVNADHSLFGKIMFNNVEIIRHPVNLDRIVKGTL